MADREIRITTVGTAELRVSGDGSSGAIVLGYASRFNVLSHSLGDFKERVSPSAFSRALERLNLPDFDSPFDSDDDRDPDDDSGDDDVIATVNHDENQLLGRTKNRSLRLATDNRGLKFRCRLLSTQAHRDLYQQVKNRLLDSCSFAFTCPQGGDDWSDEVDPDTGERCLVRTLKDVNLFDVAICGRPAYPKTCVSARQLSEVRSRLAAERRRPYSPSEIAAIKATALRMPEQWRADEVRHAVEMAELHEKLRKG